MVTPDDAKWRTAVRTPTGKIGTLIFVDRDTDRCTVMFGTRHDRTFYADELHPVSHDTREATT